MASYETDQYGGITSVKGEKTGFFHLEKINDREWFITPEGHGFVPVGISHIYGNDSEVTVKEQYGFDQKKWVDAWLDRYLELGFNSAPAGGTSPCRDKRGFIDLDYIEDRFIDKKLPFTTGVWQFPHPNELRFQQERPDIFSNYYADLVEKRAETVCTRHKDNPCEAIVQALKTENAKIYDYALNPLAETQLQEVEEEFLRYNHLMHQKV